MNKHYKLKVALFCLLLSTIFSATGNLLAQTNFGAFQSNEFSNPNNWTNGLPSPGNDGTIVGGVAANISTATTINYTLTSFGTLNLNAAVTISGTLNNFSGSVCNIGNAGSLTNIGTIDQRGALNIAPGGSFSNGSAASYSSTGAAVVTNDGTLVIAGNFANLGTISNNASAAFSSGNFTNNGTIGNNATLNLNGGTLTSVNGANIVNSSGATFQQIAGSSLVNQGTVTNDGTYQNSGEISSNGIFVNNGLFNNNLGGNIENFFRLNNTGTLNNNNQGNILNEFEINNAGVFNNNFFIDNGAAINILAGGQFNNAAAGDINNQFGSSINNGGIFANQGEILSVGEINNAATFTNNGSIYTNTGGGIVNSGNFTNESLLSNLEEITNNGIFYNNGQLQNNSGGVFTNNGDLYNNQPARISNEFDLINNQNLFNYGTIENGVRIFNFDYFENNGYLINIGDFVNEVTGVFENTSSATTTGSNGGVLENANGGVFTNKGTINNSNEIFNLACSSFVNFGIINNYYWWTNKSLFFNFGTFNELPYHQMNMEGGVEITGPSSDLVCENLTVSLDENGLALITGTTISTEAFDTCSTLTLKVNDLESLTFTCADLGPNSVTLEISDRTGNAVKCNATITIEDDRSPEFSNCPADVVVIATGTTAAASWTAPDFTDNCGPVNVTSTHIPGDLFPVGTTLVSYSATDGANNESAPCEFNVIVVPPGDCAEVASVRKVTSTYDNCGNWCGEYALTFGSGNCYKAGSDLLFIEYTDGTAQLVGSVFKGSKRAFVEIHFSGKTTAPPAGSPKFELCVNSGANGWVYYPSFEGTLTLEDCKVKNIKRYGPAFQLGKGGNLQDPNILGASGWFRFDYSSSHGGDFNFRLGDEVPCQNSIYLEAECADVIGSRWKVLTNADASGGKLLLPPNSYSYNYPPTGSDDVVKFNVNVTVAGHYRIFARSIVPNGSGDSYWVRVNNGDWVNWNTVNASHYNSFQWDQAGKWDGCDNDLPETFYLNAGSNSIQFSWREPYACLDKIFLTLTGKKPAGLGGDAKNCGNGDDGNPGGNNPFDGKTICISSRHSGKSADIYGASTSNGAKLIQWTTHGNDNQKFVFKAVGPNTYTITASHSGKCLDAYASGTQNGTKVVQWSCHGGSNQQWIVEDAGGGYFFIKNKANGLYLDVSGYSTSNGAEIHLWSKHGGNNQQWALDECGETTAPCNKNALFVVGSTWLNDSDKAVKNRLKDLGYNVTLKDDNSCGSNDADGQGLILISSTVNSSYIGSKFRNVNVPVIVWEGWLMDDMKMTGTSSNYHYGDDDDVRKIKIQDSNHPIAQGASGEIAVFNYSKTITWGRPGSGASRIGHVPGNSNRTMLFTYDTGAEMAGMTAPARRVGFFLHNNTADNLTSTGWLLFDRTVEWASGCDLGVNLESTEQILRLEAERSDRMVNLYWVNNTGFKNELFILEKSTDGVNWEVLNELDAYQNEDQDANLFEDYDFAPAIGKNYYRITATFVDGLSLTSDVQLVEINDIEDLGLYPNPASNHTFVNLETLVGERNLTIRVHDLLGRTMQEVQLDEVLEPDYRLDLNDLKTGRYTVTVIPEGKRPVSKKLIISK